MSAATVPYQASRLASSFLSFVFGVVGLAVGIDALVKGDNQKDAIRRFVPAGTTVNIDTHDVVDAGAVVSAFSGALAVVSLASLALLLNTFLTAKHGVPLSTRTLWLQGIGFTFVTLSLFASLVPMTVFVANRQANVTAFIGDVPLPQSAIQAVEDLLGTTSVYHKISYLRIAVILPWIAFLFGAISSFLSLAGAARARNLSGAPDIAPDTTAGRYAYTNERKGSLSTVEHA